MRWGDSHSVGSAGLSITGQSANAGKRSELRKGGNEVMFGEVLVRKGHTWSLYAGIICVNW